MFLLYRTRWMCLLSRLSESSGAACLSLNQCMSSILFFDLWRRPARRKKKQSFVVTFVFSPVASGGGDFNFSHCWCSSQSCTELYVLRTSRQRRKTYTISVSRTMHKTGREGKRKQRIIIFLKKKMNYLSAAAIEMLTFGSRGTAGLGSNKEFPQ